MWSPMDRELQIHRRPKWVERAAWSTTQTQGRDVADIVDGLRLSLRQAKDAITVRDEETRRLRSAVKHLEGALSLRERELRDTVLCLIGASPARPHQEWLQEGTSNSKLRLQVHRLQRAVASKQDHIEHLNRQASLGFLREAREQVEEYRIEAKRLARALAAATGGAAGYSGRISAGLTFSKPLSAAAKHADDGDGGVGPTVDRVEEDGLPAEATVVGGRSSRAIPPSGVVEVSGLSPNENEAAWQPLSTKRRNGEEVRPLQPWLVWGANEGPRVRESSSDRCGEARGREMSRDTRFAHPLTNGFDGLGLGLTAFPPSATVRGGSAGGATRPSPSRRRHGQASSRIGYRGSRGKGSASPDRSCAHGENKRRLSCMAASSRLRSSMRRSAAERNEVLALSEQARRLQAARVERARRAQLAREKISRYREERIRELESRLSRRTGTVSPDAGGTGEALPPEKGASDGGDDNTSSGTGTGNGGGGGVVVAREEDNNASAEVGDIGTGTNKESTLQRLSRQRREIDAAIAAATKESGVDVDGERQHSARGRATPEAQEEAPRGRQRRRRKRQSSGADDSFPAEDEYFLQVDKPQESSQCPARPIGKPPRAPRRSVDVGRSGGKSGARRSSSVAEEVDEAPGERGGGGGGGGSTAERFAWRSEDDYDDNDADEVQTEAGGDGSDHSIDWRNNDLSDAEGSVWEENMNFPSAGWDHRGDDQGEGEEDDDDRSKSDGPALMEIGEVHVRESSNHGSPRHRRRRRTAESHGTDRTEKTSRRNPSPGRHTAGTSEGERSGRGSTIEQSSSLGENGGLRRSSAGDGLARSTYGVDLESSDNSPPRRRRGQQQQQQQQQLERNGERAVGGRRIEARENQGHRGVSPEPRPPVATRGDSGEAAAAVGMLGASGLREQRHVVAGDPDDEGSCSSRWSLSAEDEAPEKHGVEIGSRAQRDRGGNGYNDGDLTGKPISPRGREGQERKQETNPSSVVSETTARGEPEEYNAGVEPDYVDDFFDGSDGPDVPFAVSSPSDEEVEAYADGKQTPAGVFETSAEGRPRWEHEESRVADGNTASNEQLVNARPGRPRRPKSAGRTRNANQELLQPVLPPDFSYNSGNAPEVGAAATGGAPREQAVDGSHSSSLMPKLSVVQLDRESGVNGLSRGNTEGQPTALPGLDIRDNEEGREESGLLAEEDGIDAGDGRVPQLRINSSVLFASLSSSTAGASSSPKIMAGAGGIRSTASPSREMASKRQSEISSSTFALSADGDDDDDDDLGVLPAKKLDGEAALRPSASIDANGSPGDERQYSDDDETAIGAGADADAGEWQKIPGGREIESPVPSTPGPQLAASSGHGDGTFSSEAGPASNSGPIPRERQSPSQRGNVDGVVVGEAGVTTSSAATNPSPRAEKALLSIRKQPPAVASDDAEPPSQRDCQAPEDSAEDSLSTRSVSKSSPPSGDSPPTSARLGGASVPRHLNRGADEGGDIHGQVEGAIPSDKEHDRSVADHYEDEKKGVVEHEAGVHRKGHAGDDGPTGDQNGDVVGTLEEPSLAGAGTGSPESGSVLDVGGAGVDDYDEYDDDGYF